MSTARDPRWYRLLLGWLEAGMRTTTVDRMALRSTPLKLLRFADSPLPGHTTWSTYERSDRTWRGPDVDVGYELVFTAQGDVDGLTVLRRATDVLAAMERPPLPGTVLTDLLHSIDGMGVHLCHAVLVPAWSWDGLEPLVEGRRRVEAVALVPASQAEVDLVHAEGPEALMARWDASAAHLFSPGRPPAVAP